MPHRSRLRRVPLQVHGVACLLIAVVVALGLPSIARASAPTYTSGDCSTSPDPQTCERVQILSDNEADVGDAITLAWWGIWGLLGMSFVVILAPRWFKAWGMDKKL